MPEYILSDDKQKAKPLAPELYRDSEDGVTLCVKSGSGCWDVATLTAKGQLMLHKRIPANIGLDVTDLGRIKTVNTCRAKRQY